jgi:hypothetical protein
MRKIFILVTLLFLTAFVLGACNNEDSVEEESPAADPADATETTNLEEENNETNDNEESRAENEDPSSSDSSSSEKTEEGQSNLTIGDSATVQTAIGSFELTVDSAEIVGRELDGEEAMLDELIVLDLTFKNIDDEVLDAGDTLSGFEIADNPDGSGSSNFASGFESIEEFTGEIQPGEERTAQFISNIHTSDEYYFRQRISWVETGSDQIIWTIADEEARNE